MWIRSQDKEFLGKFDMLYIDKNMSDEIVIIGCDGHVHVNDKVISACELGAYKSGKRAIEILDEIQEGMIKNAVAKVVDAEKQYIIPNPVIIYEMPKEW